MFKQDRKRNERNGFYNPARIYEAKGGKMNRSNNVKRFEIGDRVRYKDMIMVIMRKEDVNVKGTVYFLRLEGYSTGLAVSAKDLNQRGTILSKVA